MYDTFRNLTQVSLVCALLCFERCGSKHLTRGTCHVVHCTSKLRAELESEFAYQVYQKSILLNKHTVLAITLGVPECKLDVFELNYRYSISFAGKGPCKKSTVLA